MDEVSNPMFSTSMGLVFEGMKKMAPIKTEPRKIVSEVFDLVEENVQTTEDLEREEGKREGWLGRFVNKGYSSVKEFFEASPDSEF